MGVNIGTGQPVTDVSTTMTPEDTSGPEVAQKTRFARKTLGVLIAVAVALSMFSAPVAAQDGLDPCGTLTDGEGQDGQLQGQIKTVIQLIVFGGFLGGVLAICLDFASRTIPTVSSEFQGAAQKGIVFGFGLPVMLYIAKFVGEQFVTANNANLDCLFP
jgi:uncharacterized membrane protein